MRRAGSLPASAVAAAAAVATTTTITATVASTAVSTLAKLALTRTARRSVSMAGWRRTILQLLLELLVCLAHLCVSKVHLAIKVISEAAVVVESAEVGTANVANLKLLVARWSGGVLESLELTLTLLQLRFVDQDFVPLDNTHIDLAKVAKAYDFFEATVDVLFKVVDLLQLFWNF